MSEREVYIDSTVHQAVDLVYNKTFVFSGVDIKLFINKATIQIDYDKTNEDQFLPHYDCLYYPSVSTSKCADSYDEKDWDKLGEEIEKAFPNPLQTYHFYKVKRLTGELVYYLKIMLQGHFDPHEVDPSHGTIYFINQYNFILENITDVTKKSEYKTFWINVLVGLLTDQSFRVKRGSDKEFKPIGMYAEEAINFIRNEIDGV